MFSSRDADFIVNGIVRTPTPSQLPPQLASARATRDSMAGYGSDRARANFTGDAGWNE